MKQITNWLFLCLWAGLALLALEVFVPQKPKKPVELPTADSTLVEPMADSTNVKKIEELTP